MKYEMNRHGRWAGLWLILHTSYFILAGTAHAQLTATVTPGYQFSPSERPTAATLNQLGTPSILISGTISGTVGLTAGSVSGVHLADSVVDGITIMFNSSSPRALAVKPYSIGTNVVSTNLAGFSLTGGGGLPLSLTNFPSTLITNIGPGLAGGANPTNPALNIPLFVTNVDFAQLSSNALAGLTNFVTTIVTTIVTNQFILSGVPVPSAYTVTTNAHGLGVTPGFVRAVLVCVTADLGWVPGDELDVHSLGNASGGLPVVMTSANSSNVNLTLYGTGAQAWLAVRKDNVANTYAGITPGRWTIKVIARP